MSKLIEVSKPICQASYDNHFVKSITVMEKSAGKIKVRSSIRIGVDPYIERDLGHYSSTFLLEIAKQVFKAAAVLNFETHHPINRFIANEIRMDFKQYLILDAEYELKLECETDLQYRRGKVRAGQSTIWFSQDGESGASVYVDWICTTPAGEERIEKSVRMKIPTSAI